MVATARLFPPHPFVVLEDAEMTAIDLPDWPGQPGVFPTPPVIAWPFGLMIGTQAAVDGEVEVRLGWAEEVNPGRRPDFTGEITCNARELVVHTSELEIILKHSVGATRAAVSIWVNHPSMPDLILIGVEHPR